MTQLVLLVVAAAWAAVLIPPMLRSRVDNRPNSSVTDFRRQLSKLQSTATPSRGAARAMGRPLAPSPLNRSAAVGGRAARSHHRQLHVHGAPPASRQRTRQGGSSVTADRERPFRSHGEMTAGHDRPHHAHHRQTHMTPRQATPQSDVRRRRSNVLFVLVITTACTLFLAATTSSTVLLYLFVLAFLALCGYVLLLAQARQRSSSEWDDGWLERR